MRRLGAEPMTRAADLLRVGVPWFFESSGGNEACELEADVMLTNIVDLNPARLLKRHTQR
jgi:hypothetical protein